jgi:hypothetical protein
MKNTFYAFLIAAAISFAVTACSSGEYNANPSSTTNQSINPLHPLDSAGFDWASTSASPFSASINGGGFVGKDSLSGWFLDDTTGADVVYGINGLQGFKLYLLSAYAGKIYSLGYHEYKTWALYSDVDTSFLPGHAFYSYFGNSGEVQILENDIHAIRGMFYFQGVTSTGAVVNVTNGYFNINKH